MPPMEVSAWNDGKTTYGIRVKLKDRKYFRPGSIKVQIENDWHDFSLTDGFWKKCSEFRDVCGKTPIIQNWLDARFDLRLEFGKKWPKGKPPHFELTPLGNNRFKLPSHPALSAPAT